MSIRGALWMSMIAASMACGPTGPGSSPPSPSEGTVAEAPSGHCSDPEVAPYPPSKMEQRYRDGRAAFAANDFPRATALLMPVTHDVDNPKRQRTAQVLALDSLWQRSNAKGQTACWHRAVAEADWIEQRYCDDPKDETPLCTVSREIRCEDGGRRVEALEVARAYATATDLLTALAAADGPCANDRDRLLARAANAADKGGDHARAQSLRGSAGQRALEAGAETAKPEDDDDDEGSGPAPDDLRPAVRP